MGLVEREWGGCLLETTLGILEVKSCFFFSYQQMFLSGKKKLMEKTQCSLDLQSSDSLV